MIPPPENPRHQIAKADDAPPVISGERKQITVVFVDMVGSSALATRLDPEDMDEVLQAYHDAVATTVARFGGTVAQYLSDGVLIYFGWPNADERSAEDALNAALELTETLPRLPRMSRSGVQIRIGIATGLVVVSAANGRASGTEGLAVGETPNLAARLQQVAPEGTVLVSEATHKLVDGRFALRPFALPPLKGFDAGIKAFSADRLQEIDRVRTLRGQAKMPLVGRSDELATLQTAWAHAEAGTGRTVLLCGAAGVGKSRLVLALREALETRAHRRIVLDGSMADAGTPLGPPVAYLTDVAGFERTDDEATRAKKLRAFLAGAAPNLSEAAFDGLAELFAIRAAEAETKVTAVRRKRLVLDALATIFRTFAAAGPLLLVLEDAHRCDPTTHELIDRLAVALQDLPALLLVTQRPSFTPSDTLDAAARRIELAPLRADETCALIRQLGRTAHELPHETVELIAARAEGTPLFAEELTKAILEGNEIAPDRGAPPSDQPPSHPAIPTTLHDTLVARLDRLAEGKLVAQVGAVVGRAFSTALVSELTGLPESRVENALAELLVAELIEPDTSAAAYRFRHGLMREAAYSTLLKRDRRRLHGRTADLLDGLAHNDPARQPELIALHLDAAGDVKAAFDAWLKASRSATARSGLAEARTHLLRAEALLSVWAEGEDRRSKGLDLQFAFGELSLIANGHAASETGAAFARARDLSIALDLTSGAIKATAGLWLHHFVRGELDRAADIAKDALSLTYHLPDPTVSGVGLVLDGVVDYHRGDFTAAAQSFQRAWERFRNHDEAGQDHFDVQDGRVSLLNCFAETLMCLGEIDRAVALQREASLIAEAFGEPYTHAHNLGSRCYVASFEGGSSGNDTALEEDAGRLRKLGETYGFPFYIALGDVFYGRAMARQGRVSEAVTRFEQGLAGHRELGAALDVPLFMAWYGEALGHTDIAGGLQVLDDALVLQAKNGQGWTDSELLRIRAGLLASAGQAREAGTVLRSAMRVATRQSALFLALRCGLDLAERLRETDKPGEGRALLTRLYAPFANQTETVLTARVRASLDSLRAIADQPMVEA